MFMTPAILFANQATELIGSLLVYALFTIGPAMALLWLMYYLLSLPMRRQENARYFLDLVTTALGEGKPLEQTLIEISNTRDMSPGVRFHLVAAHLENGLRLGQALEKVSALFAAASRGAAARGRGNGRYPKSAPGV